MNDPLAVVECLNCGWRGQIASCIQRDGSPHCPLDGGPVEMDCEAPDVVVESDPNAETK